MERISEEGAGITIEASTTAPGGCCPACGQASARVHSTYVRQLRDLSACGQPVRVRLRVRRFFCDAPACSRRTFAEQVYGATAPRRRATLRLEAVLTAFCAALGGEAGARLAGRIGLAVAGDTLLRLLRREEADASATPTVLGVDDWAWRRGRRYGSVLVDLETRRPVDLLPERTAAALAEWLQAHPGVEVIVRDRSTEYARGAALGAPTATQVVDRWHVLRNVREVAERVLDRHAHALRGLRAGEATAAAPARRRSAAEESRRGAVREQMAERHAAIHRLAEAGSSIAGIARELRLTRTTVRRYLAATAAPERSYARPASVLDRHESYLQQRWAEGCLSGLQLWRELQARGYTGSSRPVSRWAAAQRTEPAPTTPRSHRPAEGDSKRAAPRARRPSVSRLAWLLLRAPEELDEAERDLLSELERVCPAAAAGAPLLRTIRGIIREQDTERLDGWLEEAVQCEVAEVATFAAGLKRERAELRAALAHPWSTGPVEGQITRLKLVKRQGYGRASLATLKRRFLYAA